MIALLVDTSGSVRDRLRFEQEAAVEFFQSTLVRRKDRALVLGFHADVEVIQDYTDDPAFGVILRCGRCGRVARLHSMTRFTWPSPGR